MQRDLRRIAVKCGKTLLAVVGAAVLLGSLANAAAARNLSISHQRFTATFNPLEITGGFGTSGCLLTLEGSFHGRTIAKSAGLLVGHLTSGAFGTCAAFSATLLRETLPWHIRYVSFLGALPNISVITSDIVGGAFRIREGGGITCLFRSTATEPFRIAFNRESGGALTSGALTGEIRSGAECLGLRGRITGGTSSLLNEVGTRATLTLI
jgi:hypothetical protein